LNPRDIANEDVLKAFIAEDVGYGDITSNALIDAKTSARGRIVCKEEATISGLDEAMVLLRLVGLDGTSKVDDGKPARAGTTILTTTGPARSLLSIERTLLNLLSHMSGVATATANLVSIVNRESNGRTRVACTRKTLPGLRYFEKKAVELGGGDTHRLRLDDAVLIKDNHLSVAGSIGECVRKAKTGVSFTKKIEIEVTSPAQAVEAAKAGADIILLDNMTVSTVQRSLSLLKSNNLRDRVLVEASGGITRNNIADYARTQVDIVSVGEITHSAKAIDMSMEIRASNNRS
jgi:nicotinate-nucleotide pyrophosphorylase (carboxylating)